MSVYRSAQELFDALCEPFPADMIEWRVGSTNKDKTKGLPLCYIDARAVMDRLDSICGPDGWQCNYTSGVNGSIVCNLGIQMPDGSWLWKADGAGATDFESEKGALSDAFKRAAVRWGIGRYLYDLKAPWVPLESGKYIADDERKKLSAFYDDRAPQALWGVRAGSYAYRMLYRTVQETVTSPADAIAFREKHKGLIPQLPVAMRKHLNQVLDNIGAPTSEAVE